MAAFAGMRGLGEFGTDERPKNFREGILFRNPNGTAPIFALTSKMGKMTVDDVEYSWWDEPNDLYRFVLKTAISSASATAFVFTGSDPAAGSEDTRYGDARHLVPGDILIPEPTNNAADTAANFAGTEYLTVAEKASSATNIKLNRGQLGTSGNAKASYAINTVFWKIGNIFKDGSKAPEAASRNPILYKNFCQIFRTAYQVSGRTRATRFRTGDPVKNDKRRKMFDHSQAIELSMLYGHGDYSDDGENTSMKGIREQLGANNTSVLANDWTLNTFFDEISKVFNWDSAAGDQRLAFCGNGALNALNKKLRDTDDSVRLNFDASEKIYGVRFTHFKVPQGDIMLKTHPLLSRHPVFTNSMFIIDPSNMKYVCMRGRDTRMKDDILKDDDPDLIKGNWMTDCSVRIDQGGVTMRYITGIK